jgi:hypothetical protein
MELGIPFPDLYSLTTSDVYQLLDFRIMFVLALVLVASLSFFVDQLLAFFFTLQPLQSSGINAQARLTHCPTVVKK